MSIAFEMQSNGNSGLKTKDKYKGRKKNTNFNWPH